MGTELTAECAAFRLTVTQPEARDDLRGRVQFTRESQARSVGVGLSLVAQPHSKPMGQGRVDAETSIAGCSAKVERDAEDAEFTLPLPPVAASFDGSAFRIGVSVVAVADDGSTLRLLVEVPPVGDEARLLLRRLPLEMPLARPARFTTGVLAACFGVLLVALGGRSGTEWAYALGGFGTALGIAFAGFSSRGMLGWLFVGPAQARLELGADESELVVSVKGTRIRRGRVRLVALEYEIFEGARFEHREISSREAKLVAREGGAWSARLSLPPAREAPPAVALRAPKRLLSIRWLVKIELEPRRGASAQLSVPIHVGIERLNPGAARSPLPASPDGSDTSP